MSDVDSFGIPKSVLMEMARIGNSDQYSFWVYSEPLKNPSFHFKHKTDFEVVLQSKDYLIIEVLSNKSKYPLNKGSQLPGELKKIVSEFMAQANSKKPYLTNKEIFEILWSSINE